MKDRVFAQHIRMSIAVVGIACAAWIFRDYLLTFVIEPIGWLLWAGWRLVASIDRRVIWLGLIIACGLLILRLVPAEILGRDVDQEALPKPRTRSDRLSHWGTWAARSMADAAGASAYRLSLEKLAAAVAEATRTPLSASLLARLDAQNPQPQKQAGPADLAARISRFLPGHRRRRDARLIEDLLSWMESALEITHGQ